MSYYRISRKWKRENRVFVEKTCASWQLSELTSTGDGASAMQRNTSDFLKSFKSSSSFKVVAVTGVSGLSPKECPVWAQTRGGAFCLRHSSPQFHSVDELSFHGSHCLWRRISQELQTPVPFFVLTSTAFPLLSTLYPHGSITIVVHTVPPLCYSLLDFPYF